MDNLYDNLDNYNEESTIAELRDENKGLKLKLEEYAATLEKLQKEFDIMASEHKQLEVNYSSLLKTARSEIERKTQIITKLNIEKDAMVLNSIQNRNLHHNRRQYKQINNQKESKFGKQTLISREDSFSKPSCSNQLPNERGGGNIFLPENLKTPTLNTITPHTNIQTRLLDMVNNTIGNTNINGAKNNELKENIRINNDAEKTRARISNRRKSMPIFSMDCARFSTDEDEVGSTESAKEFMSRESERRNLDSFPIGKPSLEDKVSGHLEPSRETSNRLGKYDSEINKSRDKFEVSQRFRRNHVPERRKASPERRRGSTERKRGSTERKRGSTERKRGSTERKRGSPERKRISPDRRRGSPDRRRISPNRRRVSPDRRRISPERNKKRTQDQSEELYQRQDLDKHRRLVSPPKDKYHDYKFRSRETCRSHERSHPQDDRYKSRSQDKYTMKHKMPHDNEEPSKRMRLDSHHQLEDRRKVVLEPGLVHLHDISCQSPEYTNPEVQPSHQIREIKLNATTQLEDPRRSSTKYSLKTHDGKPELSTVESANIDVKVIDTAGWEMIRTMKMPDALLQRPKSMVIPGATHQKPSPGIMSDALILNPTCPDMPDALLRESIALPHTLDQKPMSHNVTRALTKKSVSPDMPHTAGQKPMSTDISHALHLKSTASDKPLIQQQSTKMPDVQKTVSNDMPDILIQNQMSIDDPMPGAPAPISTNENHPDASNQNQKSKKLIKAMYMDIENPISNISMESGEIYDYDDVETQLSEANIKDKFEKSRQNVFEPQTCSQKLTNYKIPKKSSNKLKADEIGTDKLLPDKYKDNKLNPKLKGKISSKINVINKVTTEISEKHDINRSQKKNRIPRRRSSDCQYEFQNYMTAKEIIEGDLELSDETSDNADVQIMKRTPISDDKQDKTSVSKSSEQSIVEFDKIRQRLVKSNLEEKSKETLVKDKNPKPKKKSLKLKETNVLLEDKEAALSMDKPVKNNGNKLNEQAEIKNSPLSMDQLVKIKENITKELQNTELPTENKVTTLTIDKSVKKKENKPKELPVNKNTEHTNQKEKSKELHASKDIAAVDNPVKKRENKTKESPELKNTYKLGKKKKNKPKDSQNTAAPTMDKKVTSKECKAKETKFNELFGDSSSLVSPEDLGLVPAVVPQENYVAMFEDAQDAIDMTTITATLASTGKANETIGIAQSNNFTTNIVNTPVTTVGLIHTTQESVSKNVVQAEPTPNYDMYQNLKSEILPKENEIIKTIVISTGIQPQFTLDATEKNLINDRSEDLHVMQCVKPTVLQGMVMQALATSTPHKIGQQIVGQVTIDPMLNTRCATNESRDASVNKTPAIDNSVSNTDASLTNDADEPDMKIFVKRRRKVVKKN